MHDDERRRRTATFWSAGHYPAVAERLQLVAAELVAACAPVPGDRVLDVAAGTGNAALEAAGRGARVTASDITPAMLAFGRERTAAAGAEVEWHEADAQALPFPDGAFDLTMSVFGAIFAPDPVRAAAELARVTRPGGTLALAAWTPGGGNGRLGQIVRRHLPPSPAPAGGPEPPDSTLWGNPAVARARLEPHCEDLRLEERTLWWEFPSVEEAVAFYERNGAPFVVAREALGDAYPAMRAEVEELIRTRAERRAEGIAFPGEWLHIRGRRRPPG